MNQLMTTRTTETRTGFLGGGNWIVDQVKMIDVYPQPEQLANIRQQAQGTGGAPYNVLLNLAKMGASFPLVAAGAIGNDALGQSILDDCLAHRIDTPWLHRRDGLSTSYTDVMTEWKGGRRTFFHNRGANASWDGSDLDFNDCPARIFHLGYILLLDALDQPDAQFGTKAAGLLARAQMAGMRTSIDVVSEDSDRFVEVVTPALNHVDYCIVNEIEAGKTSGVPPRTATGQLDANAVRQAATKLLAMGIRELVVIHFPEGGYARTSSGQEVWQPSLNLPSDYIAGSAGAGDAFCAGALWGLHDGWELSRCLETAVCAAAASLAHPTCTGGMRPLPQTLALAEEYGYRSFPWTAA
jgi:sugar/nucleoside kinase (ribokinase family)